MRKEILDRRARRAERSTPAAHSSAIGRIGSLQSAAASGAAWRIAASFAIFRSCSGRAQ
jgi:hypothetical protein